jgi:hypothetical protein
MELHLRLFLLLPLWDECALLDPFGDFPTATNNVRPTQGGVGAVARRRYSLEVEDKGHLEDFVILLRCFVMFDISLNARVYSQKKSHDRIWHGVLSRFSLQASLTRVQLQHG